MSREPVTPTNGVVSSLQTAKRQSDDDRVRGQIDSLLAAVSQDGNRPQPDQSAVSVGDTVGDFELPGAGDEGIQTYRLSEYTTQGAAILVFYPFDFSPVCTTELCKFRDAELLTPGKDIDVLGISVDSAYAHEQFREMYDLQFPLLSDRLAGVADRFGVCYDEWEDHPAVAQRAMFAIDPDHTVRYRWVTEDARQSPSLDEIHDAVGWVET